MDAPARIDHDRLFKELLTVFFREFLELFAPDLHSQLDDSAVAFLDKEVFTDVAAGDRHVVDLLARVRLRGDPSMILILVENQDKPQPHFGRRMFHYFSRLDMKHGVPVYPIAVFSYVAPQRPEPGGYRVRLPGLDILRFRFRAVQLNRLSWRRFLKRENPVAAALMSRMRLAPRDRPRVKAECLRAIATLRLDPARVRLLAGFVDTYLRLDAHEAKIFKKRVAAVAPAERERLMEIVTSWEQEGIEKGLQQGLEQGRAEGIAEGALGVVVALLARRLGPLPESTMTHVRSLSLSSLQNLAEAVLDLETADDLERWLSEVPEPV
jgi:hypothetical protein